MPLTDEQKAEYLEHAGQCPFCQDWNIDGGSVEVDGTAATQTANCNACGAAWVDTYTLTSVTVTDEPEGE